MKNMKLQTKLLTFFLLVGLVPFAACAILSLWKSSGALSDSAYAQLEAMRTIKEKQVTQYFEERQGDMGVLCETVSTLRGEAVNKLTAVRETKRGAITRYLQTINDQMHTFSEDQMVVDAMLAFREAFAQARGQNGVTPEQLAAMREELKSYYTGPFTSEYKNQNSGASPEAERFFEQLDDDSIALQHAYIQANPNPLGEKHKLDRAHDASTYSQIHARVHPIIRSYLEKFGYYDIFLCDPVTGDIVYSVFKELDYSTSLIDGPYAQTNFGEAFRKANEADSPDAIVLVDYAQYPPSYEAAASFIASPIFDGNTKVGVALFQMPIDRINAIMAERSGLGETGETYVVGQDLLMRSDSYLDPEHHSVLASFRNPEKGRVDTAAAKAALAGESGANVIIDYNGNPVLSAYAPVEIGGLTWALLAEIDVAEAFCPKNEAGEYYFEKYANMYGYYDLFLLNPDGYCFYTVAKEADYQTNLVDGKYASSNLGKAVRKCLDTKQFAFGDFAPYEPSAGAPAAFIAQPVAYEGEVELVVALQLSDGAISGMMAAGSDKERTLEAYLVGEDGYMRSNSILNPDHYSIAASFAKGNKVDTEAKRGAIGGGTDARVITDYLGSQVLSAWAPLDVFGAKWALLCEIDEAVAFEAVKVMQWLMGAIAVVGVVAIALVALLIARSITKPINGVIEGMTVGSEQVTSASNQVSQSSQQMASGASEQASSLEETSASLEEMASMTRRNADNANQANGLMGEAKEVVTQGGQAMGDMAAAIEEMKRSADETAKIIKTIDEIAFQTNLLALNAAVEAARAGDAGKGFAVVAEEVRNLAQRSAEAARETSLLIETSQKNADSGVQVTSQMTETFSAIEDSAGKVASLVSEIAAACNEQAQGIDQINTAVAQMDQVTQSNAASSEEAASASEELSAQATELNDMVGTLVSLVGGSRGTNGTTPRAARKAVAPGAGDTGQRALTVRSSETKKVLAPEQVLPLNDEDLSEF